MALNITDREFPHFASPSAHKAFIVSLFGATFLPAPGGWDGSDAAPPAGPGDTGYVTGPPRTAPSVSRHAPATARRQVTKLVGPGASKRGQPYVLGFQDKITAQRLLLHSESEQRSIPS